MQSGWGVSVRVCAGGGACTCVLVLTRADARAVAAGHTDAIISFLREKGFFIAKRRDVTVTRDLVPHPSRTRVR